MPQAAPGGSLADPSFPQSLFKALESCQRASLGGETFGDACCGPFMGCP